MGSIGWDLLGLVIGFLVGYHFAHVTVSEECEKLGKFFVGDKVYHCNLIEERRQDTVGGEQDGR